MPFVFVMPPQLQGSKRIVTPSKGVLSDASTTLTVKVKSWPYITVGMDKNIIDNIKFKNFTFI